MNVLLPKVVFGGFSLRELCLFFWSLLDYIFFITYENILGALDFVDNFPHQQSHNCIHYMNTLSPSCVLCI